MERIYMDEFHYEAYDNYKEALEAWSNQTAHTQIAINADLDYEVGLEGLSDVIMFDEKKLEEYIGTEGIKDTVKNMASRVKSNLSLWLKKFINFFFGWIINFFKGVVNIRKSLKSGYDKAREYLKKMNDMTSKLGGDFKNKEGEAKTVKVSTASPLLIRCLSTVLISSYALMKLEPVLTNVKVSVDEAQKQESSANDNKSQIDTAAALTIINKLAAGIVGIGGLCSIADPRDDDFYNTFKNNYNYSITKWAESAEDVSKVLEKKYNQAEQGLGNFIYNIWKAVLGSNNEKTDLNLDKAKEESYNAACKAIKAVLADSAKAIEVPEPEEMEYSKAFAIIREGLNAFINISGANKDLWKFEKYAEAFEKTRRKLLSLIDKFNPDDDDAAKNLFNRVTSIGQLMSAVSTNANKCMQNVNKLLDTIITDATRLGSALTSIK